MAAFSVSNPFQFFHNLQGQPLYNGHAYIGTANLDPRTNPISVYWDEALTIAAAQPISISAGFPMYQGAPANIYVGVTDYSIRIEDAVGALVYSAQSAPLVITDAQVSSDDGAGGTLWATVKGFISYLRSSIGSSIVGFIQSGTGAVATNVQSELRTRVNVEQFGATGNGVTNDVASIQAAIDRMKTSGGGELDLSGLPYLTNAAINVKGVFTRGLALNGKDGLINFSHAGAGLYLGLYSDPGAEFRLKLKTSNVNVTGPGKATASSVAARVEDTADVMMTGGILSGAEKGLWLNGALICDFTQQVIRDCGTGVVANTTVNFAPNAVNFTNARIISNDLAVNFADNPNGVANWFGCEIENNNAAGNAADGKVVTSLTNAGHHNLIGCHFEANNGQVSVRYSGSSTAKSLLIAGSEMIDSAAGTGVDVTQGRATIIASRITGVIGTNFGANASGTLIDSETTPAGSLGNVIGIRDGRIAFGANPLSVDPLIRATSAAMTAASNIATSFQSDTVQHRALNAAGSRIGYMSFFNAGSHAFVNDQAHGWTFTGNGVNQLIVGRSGGSSIEPGADNTISCGGGALRWSVVYAATGAINTSDERTKTQIEAIPQAWLDAWGDVEFMRFKFNDAVARKGDGARWHIGVVAQRVRDAFEARGLDPFSIGILCWDEWGDVEIEKPVEDKNGNPMVDAESGQPIVEKVLINAAGDLYGIRYEEALALECAYLRSKMI